MTLDTILLNDVSVGQLITWLGAVAAIYALFKIFKTLFTRRKVILPHTVYFVCNHCGWEGHISKFGTRCPKCNAPTGDLGAGT